VQGDVVSGVLESGKILRAVRIEINRKSRRPVGTHGSTGARVSAVRGEEEEEVEVVLALLALT
jgi:hypothetical protein